MELEGSTFLILGGSGGIGSALSRRLAERGAHVVVAGRNEETVPAVAEEVGGTSVLLDATDFDAVGGAVDRAREAPGELAGGANCVGSILLRPARMTSREEFDETVAQNLASSFALVRGLAPVLGRNGGGSLAFLSSAAAQVGLPNHEAVAAAKAGVEGLVRAAAASWAGRGVRFNAVAPGLVDTPLASRITSNEKSLETSRAMHPLGRIGNPGEVADILLWLLTPSSGWVTGSVVGADGGMARIRAG
jgi:NAD(P)-dependent dehydrogenase (short-subunit alcohol dehydrogenase family)